MAVLRRLCQGNAGVVIRVDMSACLDFLAVSLGRVIAGHDGVLVPCALGICSGHDTPGATPSFSKSRIDHTLKELLEERDAVADLLK